MRMHYMVCIATALKNLQNIVEKTYFQNLDIFKKNVFDFITKGTGEAADSFKAFKQAFQNKVKITTKEQPLVADFDNTYYVVLENTHIFAEKEGVLQTIIANQRSGFTFDKGPIYQTVKKQLGNESSMLFISSSKGINSFVSQFLDEGLAKELEDVSLKDYGFGAQLTNDIDFSHFNLFVTNIKKVPTKNTVAPIYNLELNSDLIIQPQFVKNHRNKKYEIVVQDSDYNLYLISTEGKVLWKKQLGGSIQGKIHQVDLYKNGKLQLAFCTNNEFLILDRNGDEVAPFTMSFEGGNLNGLAVFDYENNRKKRIR